MAVMLWPNAAAEHVCRIRHDIRLTNHDLLSCITFIHYHLLLFSFNRILLYNFKAAHSIE